LVSPGTDYRPPSSAAAEVTPTFHPAPPEAELVNASASDPGPKVGAGGGNHSKHDLAVRNSNVQTGDFRSGEIVALLWPACHRLFRESNLKSRTNALLSATAGLYDADFNEVRLYALFRKSRVAALGEAPRNSSEAS